MDLVADLIPGTISKFTDSNKPSQTKQGQANPNSSSPASNGSAHNGSASSGNGQGGITPSDLSGGSTAGPSANQSQPSGSHPIIGEGTLSDSSALPQLTAAVPSAFAAAGAAELADPPVDPSFSRAALDKLWTGCLETIRAELDVQIFAAWIRPLRLLAVKKDPRGQYTVIIGAANKFTVEHIQKQYSEQLAIALAGALGADALGLSFRVEPRVERRPPTASTAQRDPFRGTEGIDPSRAGSREVDPANRADLAGRAELNHRNDLTHRPDSGRREETGLNPKYNFSNFVVGSCNQFAHAACLRVSETPGSNYNPLFLYGGVGLGKTHLANAIGNSTRRQNKKVLLVSSETFVSELIASLRSNRMQQFKERFRSLDLLIIDDIQFIIGKERTQEEFFHTFNDLYGRRKQIVITSDTLPQDLSGIEERLRTRFACGLSVDLQVPDLETRVAILTKKAEAAGVRLNIDVARYIADAVNTNVRELEGAFNRLQAMCSLGRSESGVITLEIAQEVVRDFRPRRQVEITTEVIQRTVAERYNVSISDLLGKRRTHNVALARQVAMFLCRKLTTYSYPEIGAYFGGRDHSTVIHSFRSVEEKLGRDKELSAILDEIQRIICG